PRLERSWPGAQGHLHQPAGGRTELRTAGGADAGGLVASAGQRGTAVRGRAAVVGEVLGAVRGPAAGGADPVRRAPRAGPPPARAPAAAGGGSGPPHRAPVREQPPAGARLAAARAADVAAAAPGQPR